MSMEYYVDITLLPSPGEDISLYFLWSKLYQQLHLAWVEAKDDKGRCHVGVSFPHYDFSKRQLGSKLRLFARSEQALDALNLSKWLSRLSDYVHLTGIREVPHDKVKAYGVFSRLHSKENLERLARRRAKKLDVPYETALAFFQDTENRPLPSKQAADYPYIQMQSLGTGHRFTLVIQMQESEQVEGFNGFSTYGLSSVELITPVPLF